MVRRKSNRANKKLRSGDGKIALDFMVDPYFLMDRAYVPCYVKVIITNPRAIFLTGILGESGRKLVRAGAPFYFTKLLAEELIEKGIARRVDS